MKRLIAFSLCCATLILGCGKGKATSSSAKAPEQKPLSTSSSSATATGTDKKPVETVETSVSNANRIATTTEVSAFTVMGIKLGMKVDEVQALLPDIQVMYGGLTANLLMSNHVDRLRLDFASKPYGDGVCWIAWSKHVGGVDSKTFIDQFRTDLAARYGPSTSETKTDGSYEALWGGRIIRSNIWPEDSYHLRGSAKDGNVLSGQFLRVLFKGQFVTFDLIDTVPFIVEAQVEKQQEIETAKKKVDF